MSHDLHVEKLFEAIRTDQPRGLSRKRHQSLPRFNTEQSKPLGLVNIEQFCALSHFLTKMAPFFHSVVFLN